MKKNILGIINGHEQEDKQKVSAFLRQSILEEFENADIYLNAIDTNRYDLIPDYTVSTSPNLPVKKADKFYIRKHTCCIEKYFHSHNFYELIYVHSGKCEQYLKNNEKITIHERQLCLLTPEAVHALEPAKAEDLVFKIYIPTELFTCILLELKKELPVAAERIAKNNSIHYFNTETGFLDFLLMKLIEESVFKYEGKDTAIKSSLTLMFLNLLRETNPETDFCLQQKAKEYIESDFSSANLKAFSFLLGYSVGHTGRLLKEKLNYTFSELLQALKMEQAEKLLLETDLSLEYIAAELGYSNASGLYKQFYKTYAIAPGKYRTLKK